MTNTRKKEPMFECDNTRFTQLPYKYPEIQGAYIKAENSFWSASEIDYTADLSDWGKLSYNEKYFIEHVLAFFAGADGIVVENLVTNFCSEIQIPEARNFYGFQIMIENIHGMVYSQLIDTFIKNPERKKELFNAIDNIPCISKKANWAMKWIDKKRPFEQRLIAFAVIEGIFFSGSFCSIFWLKNRGKMVKALGHSNELISRDEGMHTDFAVLLYSYLENKVSQETVEEIIKEAVEIEEEFICESLPCALLGMNNNLMKQYIHFVSDRLLTQLGFKKIYNEKNPFNFMNNISLNGKSNFFEKRVTEYMHTSGAEVNDDLFDDDSIF
jgi:ribonucleoside-diphosphate reductase subunit M2